MICLDRFATKFEVLKCGRYVAENIQDFKLTAFTSTMKCQLLDLLDCCLAVTNPVYQVSKCDALVPRNKQEVESLPEVHICRRARCEGRFC